MRKTQRLSPSSFCQQQPRAGSADRKRKELWGDVIASGVDGVLYINDELTNEHLELIMEASVDVVLTNTICNDPGVPSVSIDYVKAAYDITKEMIARGNKRFG